MLATTLLALCGAACWVSTVQAQTPTNSGGAGLARPAANAPARPASATTPAAPTAVGGKKIMTRDELRACLKRNDDQKLRANELDDLAVVINAQRAEIEQGLDAIRAERATLETRATRIREFQPKMQAYSQKVQEFNTRMGELSSKTRMTTSEGRAFEQMRKQVPLLEEERKDLNAERDRLLEGYEDSIKAFAIKAKVVEERAAEWNRRKAQHAQDNEDLSAASADWRRDCADRPYREEDEKAIRAGK